MNSKGGYYFIATVLDVDFDLPAEITPTLLIEKANSEQVKKIGDMLAVERGLFPTTNRTYYETEILCTKKESNGFSSYEFKQLNKNKWKYYIITYKGSNYESSTYLNIASFVSPYIYSFIDFSTEDVFGKGAICGSGGDFTASSNFYSGIKNRFPKKFKLENLEETKQLYLKYIKLDREKHEGIIRATEVYYKLRHTKEHDNLYILALFMIIEMLLTHNPRSGYDSLTHQITEKMAFISHRLRQPLDYSAFGTNTKYKTLWGKLYDYRSKIAHGEHPNFEHDLKLLGSKEKACEFLLSATRSILAYAIEEPDIVNGLKPI